MSVCFQREMAAAAAARLPDEEDEDERDRLQEEERLRVTISVFCPFSRYSLKPRDVSSSSQSEKP